MKPSIPRPKRGSSPFHGPDWTRRAFLKLNSRGLAATWCLQSLPTLVMSSVRQGVATRSTARNAIFISLIGAPSQTDTFDLKDGPWTPPDFRPTTYPGNVRFPEGLMPRIADHLGDIAIVRSLKAWATVHDEAQSWMVLHRGPGSSAEDLAPHIGAVAALEMESRVRPVDALPAFIALDERPVPASPGPGRKPLSGRERWSARRLRILSREQRSMGSAPKDSQLGQSSSIPILLEGDRERNDSHSWELSLLSGQVSALTNPDLHALLSATVEERLAYGSSSFGDACFAAAKLIEGRRGARFVQVSLGGWDNHCNIYADDGFRTSLYTQCRRLDSGLAALLDTLKSTSGTVWGKSLLDETLVVVVGEFGRSVGVLNRRSGRDHFSRMSALMAGGGIRGGRAIGATDRDGENLEDSGWSEDRDIRPEDLAATVYSALGIDWTTVRCDDASNRKFEYIPYASEGSYGPIDELFD